MGERHRGSRFATMQLFHELKQQFPTIPDDVVSRCIAQNNHDRESCARSLRETEQSRPPPGAFPPPAPRLEPLSLALDRIMQDDEDAGSPIPKQQRRSLIGPLSLDIGADPHSGPSSAPSLQGPLTVDTSICPIEDFELSEEIMKEFSTPENEESTQCPALLLAATPIQPTIPEESAILDELPSTRGFTALNVTLKQPEPRFTKDSSPGPELGFQSNLSVSLGRGSFGAGVRTRQPPPVPQRPSSLIYPSSVVNRPAPAVPKSMTASSAPTTPCFSAGPPVVQSTSSLPTTPCLGSALPGPPTSNLVTNTSRGAIPRRYSITTDGNTDDELDPESIALLKEVEDQHKPLLKEQLTRCNRLSRTLETDKRKLEDLRKEVEGLKKNFDSGASYKDTERQLKSEIWQLQVECERLAKEIDIRGDSKLPLGETNKEFYQSIYTGQQFCPNQINPEPSNIPPPLPSQPPAWEPEPREIANQEDQDGPSWVCQRCTFNNHPLLNSCEECYLPRPIIIRTPQGTQMRNTNRQFSTSISSFPSTSR